MNCMYVLILKYIHIINILLDLKECLMSYLSLLQANLNYIIIGIICRYMDNK